MNHTIQSLQDGYRDGSLTIETVVHDYYQKARTENERINAYLEFFDDIDEQITASKTVDGPLSGVPLAIKDNILIEGREVGAASRLLENYTASYDATVIQRLRAAGAIFLGRTNMDEFAMGSSTENSAFGPTKNPLDTTKVPGGSSGGSAAAVAMGGALAALGTDTGGSVRQPASFCGLVGLYPTYGAVSRSGIIALASSLDQVGPLGRTVADVETLYHVIAGHDPLDSTSVPDDHRTVVDVPMTMRIGVPQDFLAHEGIDPAVRENFQVSLKRLEALGHTIIDISLPLAAYALAAYYIILPAEASSNLARFDGIRYGNRKDAETLLEVYEKTRGEGFGKEVRRRILLGTFVLSHGYYDAYYRKATAVRDSIREEFKRVFSSVDVIATPTTPTTAFAIGEKVADPVSMYLSDMLTVPANIAGIPALSVPSGQSDDGLPFGLQLIGPHFAEQRLFALGKQFE